MYLQTKSLDFTKHNCQNSNVTQRRTADSSSPISRVAVHSRATTSGIGPISRPHRLRKQPQPCQCPRFSAMTCNSLKATATDFFCFKTSALASGRRRSYSYLIVKSHAEKNINVCYLLCSLGLFVPLMLYMYLKRPKQSGGLINHGLSKEMKDFFVWSFEVSINL